jgi:hypothetical protein
VSHLFEPDKVKKAFPDRSVIVRSGGHRHVVIDIDSLLESIVGGSGGSGTGGGVPVVDGSTGTVVAIAQPDPVNGGYVYVDPRTTVVEESSGSGRSVAATGLPIRAVINTSSPTTPPPDLGGGGAGAPPATSVDEAPVTRPRCDGADCFVKVPCHSGGGTSIHINPQALFSPTNLGGTPLLVMFAGPLKANGKRAVIQEVEIGPGVTAPNLIPPHGTDTIFIACTGSGDVTFRWTAGVAID